MSEQVRLRREKQTARRAMTEEARAEAAENIAHRLLSSDPLRRATHVGCYLAWGAEVDTSAIIEHLWAHNKTCYLPVLVPSHQNRLWFVPFYPDTVLKKNQYGIFEPKPTKRNRARPQKLDAVMVPLVAFDQHGTRIGMGGGYYDRTLAFRRTRTAWLKPVLVGLAYECQKTAVIASNPWDVRLDAIVTERTIYRPSSSSPKRQT